MVTYSGARNGAGKMLRILLNNKGEAKAVQLTGSRHLQRYSHNIWMQERNAHGETEDERNTSTVRVVKNREHGTTGCFHVRFDPMTSKMVEISSDEVPEATNQDKDIRNDVQNPFMDT